ncbi:flavin reductase [Halothiobacillus diazotrophicus]|uniref:Flavin reductase n=1 Tax=Halothiobacillus diazotrophicus TaxID=1860122 RepID=A0A191ZFX4_9GAMM|nr:flavin reductase family protein [Halothiobacillus diazotrophicus]ANJ66781.1 flavin reductase [Halothiobacillus diazotrophicus]
MHIDPAQHTKMDNYKLLTNLVIPRPIAWISTQNAEGVVNLAPYSFFNAVGSDPLYVVFSAGLNEAGQPKDTLRNLRANGEFVVNLVTPELFDAMNVSAADFPADLSEVTATDLHTAPSVQVKTPRVAEAKASLECRVFSEQQLGANTLVIGEVVGFYVDDALIGDRMHIHDFAPIGRLGSPSVYCNTTDRFDIARVSYAEWQKQQV